MSKSTTEEFELCNNACKDLIAKYGYKTPIINYPENSRCVVLIWTAMGKIENGGFEYLFGATLPGDPYYKYTLNAFKEIGCIDAYEAFMNALCQFHKCTPPLDDYDRIRLYHSIPEEKRDHIDSSFWKTTDHIISCLALYIRTLT